MDGDANGCEYTYGNGIVHTLAQNARGLPATSQDAYGATAIHQDEYAYDQVGNVLYVTDAATGQNQRGNRSMAYDGLDRLTSATSPMFGTASYAYDVLDNLTHVTVTGGSQARDQGYVYDASNRLTNLTSGGATVVGLGYDVQGNLANKNGVGYTFDYGNRLRGVGNLEGYRYDVAGRRVLAWSPTAGNILSVYGQDGVLRFQQNQRTATNVDYIYLGGSLVATLSYPYATGVGTVKYQHTDALGSPVATTNSAKTVLQRSEYEPYGYLLNRPMQDGPGYTGHVTDAATGLVYMQQRYYDPEIGAFPTTDPVTPFSAGGAFNRYWYANANPYRMVDPDGRTPNEVYLASGGDWGSGQTVSAGRRNRSNARVPYSEANTQQRLDAANKALEKLRKALADKRALTADGIAAYFAYLTQPISTKYTVEIFFHSSPAKDGWRIDEAHVSNEFWAGSGIGGGQSGNPLDLGETGGHTHPFNTPFSLQDLGALGVFYVSRPDGTMSVYNPYQGEQGKVTDLRINLWDY